jgi:hypothetical protein
MTCIKLHVWLIMIFLTICASKHYIYQINKNKDGRTMNDSGYNIALVYGLWTFEAFVNL